MADKKVKTQDRIILTSLDLFNLEGEPNVTTVDIANELDISPGNLYYHFRGKELIIKELYDRFEERMLPILNAPLQEPLKPDDSWFYLYVLFEELYAFRFLYRNLVDILQRNPDLEKRFNRLMDTKLKVAHSMCGHLRDKGYLGASDQEITSLSNTIVLMLTFWLNFRDLRSATDDPRTVIHQGVYQIMSAIAPYLLLKSQLELYQDYQHFVKQL